MGRVPTDKATLLDAVKTVALAGSPKDFAPGAPKRDLRKALRAVVTTAGVLGGYEDEDDMWLPRQPHDLDMAGPDLESRKIETMTAAAAKAREILEEIPESCLSGESQTGTPMSEERRHSLMRALKAVAFAASLVGGYEEDMEDAVGSRPSRRQIVAPPEDSEGPWQF